MAEVVAADRLRSFIQRIETIEEELTELKQDRAEVYSEAKSEGFDAPILRKIVARRKRDPQEVREEEEIMALYLDALGDTPLEAAIRESKASDRASAENSDTNVKLTNGNGSTVEVNGVSMTADEAKAAILSATKEAFGLATIEPIKSGGRRAAKPAATGDELPPAA